MVEERRIFPLHLTDPPACGHCTQAERGCNMKDYIVRVLKWIPGKRAHEEIHEFDTEEDAKDYAEFKAGLCRKYGYEFAIRIYKAQE